MIQLIDYLDTLQGNGTSMITMLISKNNNQSIENAIKMLQNEACTAMNIKSRL